LPNKNKTFHVHVDASRTAMEVVSTNVFRTELVNLKNVKPDRTAK
jgi:hypothetical protein